MSNLVYILIGIVSIGAIAMSSPAMASTPGAFSDPAFDLGFQVIGRWESNNNYSCWNADDVGSGASVGYIQFNQKSGLLFLLREAKKDPRFSAAFGRFADDFRNENWVRTANLNNPAVKRQLISFLGSQFGQELQRRTAYEYYWKPAQSYVDSVKDSVDTAYRVLAFSVSVQFDPATWKEFVDDAESAKDIADSAIAHTSKRSYAHHVEKRYRRILQRVGG